MQTASGNIVPGVIVENVSLGFTMCAERVTLFSTVALGARPLALALVAPRTGDDLRAWPCGACLQVALELGGPAMPIYVELGRADAPISESTSRTPTNGPYVRR